MPEFAALVEGYRRFRGKGYIEQRARWDRLSISGQDPKVMVIACSDSRVDPTNIFDAEPGQIFVVRNVANLVPPMETSPGRHGVSAALEYAVVHLKVEHIVVLGHAQCGGIHAALQPGLVPQDSFIGKWISLMAPARDRVMMALEIEPDINPQQALEFASIRQSLANLRSFSFVTNALNAGCLKIHGAHFGISDGTLRVLRDQDGRFEAVNLVADA
jgi:carbonic anhydrase